MDRSRSEGVHRLDAATNCRSLPKHYFILSIDGLYTPPKNTYVKNHRDSIGNIFRGTALDDIKDESFELVFRYLLVCTFM